MYYKIEMCLPAKSLGNKPVSILLGHACAGLTLTQN